MTDIDRHVGWHQSLRTACRQAASKGWLIPYGRLPEVTLERDGLFSLDVTKIRHEGELIAAGGFDITAGAGQPDEVQGVLPNVPKDYPPLGTAAKSACPSPTKLVWQIADRIIGCADITKELTRTVVEEATRQGVNLATAKTQIYRWRKARQA